MELNRWKDGTGSFLAADQKARLPICSPNRLELLFSILQIPKQPSQVKGKKSKTSNLELSAQLTADINREASGDPGKKRQGTEEEDPAQHFTAYAGISVFSEHTHNSEIKCAGLIEKHASPHDCNFLRFLQIFWIWLSILCLARYQTRSKGLQPITLVEELQFKQLLPNIIPLLSVNWATLSEPISKPSVVEVVEIGQCWNVLAYLASGTESQGAEGTCRGVLLAFSSAQCGWKRLEVSLESLISNK